MNSFNERTEDSCIEGDASTTISWNEKPLRTSKEGK